jgi:hypothetical protein
MDAGFRRRRAPLQPALMFGLVAALSWSATGATRLSGHAGTRLEEQGARRTIWDGVFTEAQARRGEGQYKAACGYCHRDDLSGGFLDDGVGRAPALAGPRAFGTSFAERWNDHSVGEMLVAIASTMPQPAPSSLSLSAYLDIVSFLLEKNGAPAGDRELPADPEALSGIVVTDRPAR